jgi:hypothetical protein
MNARPPPHLQIHRVLPITLPLNAHPSSHELHLRFLLYLRPKTTRHLRPSHKYNPHLHQHLAHLTRRPPHTRPIQRRRRSTRIPLPTILFRNRPFAPRKRHNLRLLTRHSALQTRARYAQCRSSQSPLSPLATPITFQCATPIPLYFATDVGI